MQPFVRKKNKNSKSFVVVFIIALFIFTFGKLGLAIIQSVSDFFSTEEAETYVAPVETNDYEDFNFAEEGFDENADYYDDEETYTEDNTGAAYSRTTDDGLNDYQQGFQSGYEDGATDSYGFSNDSLDDSYQEGYENGFEEAEWDQEDSLYEDAYEDDYYDEYDDYDGYDSY